MSDDEERAALLGSIAKWEAIEAGTGVDLGIANCPLCAMYYSRECDGCPVSEKTGLRNCSATPYEDWDNYFYQRARTTVSPPFPTGGRRATNAFTKQIAHDEVEFLRSLLPREP